MIDIMLHYDLDSRPRYGYGRPPHRKLYEIMNKQREVFRSQLTKFLSCYDLFESIAPSLPVDSASPAWQNIWISGLDLISICGLLKQYNPKNYIEIGSGNTTKFARETIEHYHLRTRITSIDPQPRAEIDGLCDIVIRDRLENIALDLFMDLEPGDMIFMDGSHHTLMNSDACVLFLDILPYLPSRVVVGCHDIFLPDDYPPDWIDRYYSEQYLLASYLLAGGNSFDILLANNFIAMDEELSRVLMPIWLYLPWITRHGAAFWIIKR